MTLARYSTAVSHAEAVATAIEDMIDAKIAWTLEHAKDPAAAKAMLMDIEASREELVRTLRTATR